MVLIIIKGAGVSPFVILNRNPVKKFIEQMMH